MIRNNWTISEINEIYHTPLLDLVYRAATVHREFNETGEVQVCTLLSIKTGRMFRRLRLLPAGRPVFDRRQCAGADAKR
jgi:biotin synthase-like enzyme